MSPLALSAALFPYTTLFRSVGQAAERVAADAVTAGEWNPVGDRIRGDRKSTRLNSSHVAISYAVFSLKKKTATNPALTARDLLAAQRNDSRSFQCVPACDSE